MSSFTSPRGVLHSIRRYWPIVLATVVILTALPSALSLLSDPEYRSEAQVLVSDRDLGGAVAGLSDDYGEAERLIATEVQIAALPSITDEAEAEVRAAGTGTTATADVDLRVASSARTSGESNILRVVVDSGDGAYAQALATAVAQRYVTFRRELDTRELRRARDQVASRIGQLEEAGAGQGQLFDSLQQSLQQLDTLIVLGSSRANMLETGSRAEQIGPQPLRAGVIGLLVGLLAGAAVAVVRGLFDRGVESHDEVAEILSVPILGTLPDPSQRADGPPKLPARDDPASAGAEAFRLLRTHTKFALAARNGRTMLITSAKAEEGKTFCVANLGVTAAAAGDDVILVDLDLRKSNLHRYLRKTREPGLSDVVAGEVSLDDALAPVPLHDHVSADAGRLRLLSAGRRVVNPGEFVASDAVAQLLEEIAATYRPSLILVDTPPMLAVSDATTLAALVDATAVVVRAPSASRKTLHGLHTLLSAGPHRPLGAILTAAFSRRLGYGYGQGYGVVASDGRDGGASVPVVDERKA